MQTKSLVLFVILLSVMFVCAAPACSQESGPTGKLKIHVDPKQAYVFVDGKAIRDGSQTIELSAGDHQVGVYNYGYLAKIQQVHIGAGEKTDLRVALQSSGTEVAGPFAYIEFKGEPRAAVLLNGKTPAYFVGHVDEFDWDWIWHQRLLVKPGTYQVTVTRKGNTIWSGTVNANAGQKVVVYLDQNGRMKTKKWDTGLNLGPLPRFHAGIASATVPIAPVTASLSAQATNLNCGQSTELKWKTTDAVDTSISGLGQVPHQGDRELTPKGSSIYKLTAKGPGGEAIQSVAVDVAVQPTASFSISRPEVRYHKVGDKVVEEQSAMLNWSVSNANSARIDPLGTEALQGSQAVMPDLKETTTGPIDKDVTYTLTATNACGGSVTSTATLHVVGSIEPPPAMTLASMFYPTAYPTSGHPNVGLVASEKKALTALANHFEDYQQYDQKATLLIVGHADIRGSTKYNDALSRRRAELVQTYLVSQGIPAWKIQVSAEGKDQQLPEAKVENLQSQDTQKPERWMTKNKKATWLAYNRRADIVLEPKAQVSSENYPNDVAGVRILWQRSEPNLTRVEHAGGGSASSSLRASAAHGRS